MDSAGDESHEQKERERGIKGGNVKEMRRQGDKDRQTHSEN